MKTLTIGVNKMKLIELFLVIFSTLVAAVWTTFIYLFSPTLNVQLYLFCSTALFLTLSLHFARVYKDLRK